MAEDEVEDRLRAAKAQTSQAADEVHNVVDNVDEKLQKGEEHFAQKAEEWTEKGGHQIQRAEDQIQRAEDQIGHYASDSIAFIRGSANQTQQALEQGIDVASEALKSGAVTARQQYDRAYQRSQVCLFMNRLLQAFHSETEQTFWGILNSQERAVLDQ